MAHRKELGVTEHSVLTVVVVVPQCCAFVKNHTRATTDYKLKSTLLRGKHSCWSSENVEYFSTQQGWCCPSGEEERGRWMLPAFPRFLSQRGRQAVHLPCGRQLCCLSASHSLSSSGLHQCGSGESGYTHFNNFSFYCVICQFMQ